MTQRVDGIHDKELGTHFLLVTCWMRVQIDVKEQREEVDGRERVDDIHDKEVVVDYW